MSVLQEAMELERVMGELLSEGRVSECCDLARLLGGQSSDLTIVLVCVMFPSSSSDSVIITRKCVFQSIPTEKVKLCSNNNNNELISRTLFHVKHARLR